MATITIPAVNPTVRTVLVNDPDVRHLVRDRVYAGTYPSVPVDLPAVRFRFISADPMSDATARWWNFTGAVYCHAETEGEADLLAGAVLGALLQMEGTTHDGIVVQAVTNWGVQSVLDSEWTPPKPMRIVTVTLTARAV